MKVKKLDEAQKMVEKLFPTSHGFSKRYILNIFKELSQEKDNLDTRIMDIKAMVCELLCQGEFHHSICQKLTYLYRDFVGFENLPANTLLENGTPF